MKHFSGRLVGLVAGVVLLCSSALAQNGGLRFTLTDLGSFGGNGSRAFAINNKGRVVGTAFFSNPNRAMCFSWQAGSTPILFSIDPKSMGCDARAVGPDGTIAGGAGNPEDPNMSIAFRRDPTGRISLLKPLGGDAESKGFGVLKQTVVGYSYDEIANTTSAVKWESDGTLTQLASGASVATGINSLGKIVGWTATLGGGSQGSIQPWVWYNGSLKNLSVWTPNGAAAWAINTNGFVAGGAYDAGYLLYGALWNSVARGTPLTILGYNNGAQGLAISSDNWVVGGGYWLAPCTPGCPSLSVPDLSCSLTDLNTLLDASGAGWYIAYATGINDSHQIAAWARRISTGEEHAVLLTPNNLPLCYPA